MKDRDTSTEIERRQAERMVKAKLTADEVLIDLANAMRFNPKVLYREDGSLKAMHELPDDVAKQLEGTEFEEITVGAGEQRQSIGRVAKVKYPKKSVVREQAMKHFGLYEVDNRQKTPKTVLIGQLTVQPEALSFDKVRARALELKRSG